MGGPKCADAGAASCVSAVGLSIGSRVAGWGVISVVVVGWGWGWGGLVPWWWGWRGAVVVRAVGYAAFALLVAIVAVVIAGIVVVIALAIVLLCCGWSVSWAGGYGCRAAEGCMKATAGGGDRLDETQGSIVREEGRTDGGCQGGGDSTGAERAEGWGEGGEERPEAPAGG